MLMSNYTLRLLDLEDVIITNVENIEDRLHIYLKLPRTAHTCPACGTTTDRIHDYRILTVGFLDDYGRGNQFSKVIHDQSGKDLIQ